MQTTLRLDEQLLGAAKRAALARGESLNRYIIAALRKETSRGTRPAKRRTTRLATFRGRGLCQGVNLNDSATLLDHMEGR